MPAKRTPVELNEPTEVAKTEELRQYLISASNSLYLFELFSEQENRPVPEALKRAHSALRAEIKRMEAQKPRVLE